MRIFYLFLLVILPLACNNSSGEDVKKGEISYVDFSEDEMPINGIVSMEEADFEEQKIIKESYLRFETNDLDKTYGSILYYVKNNNGFIQSDNANKSYDRQSRNLIIRVPTQNFQSIIDSITTIVDYFDTKQVSLKDVTEEFIDLEARLKAKLELEKRYLELLSKAQNVKEMLEIERELSHIREEIEAKQGRLKYLNDRVSLSTLNIEFYKISAETGVRTSYGRKMWNALQSGFNGLSIFFLGLLNIWPFIIIVILGVYLIRKQLKKRQKK
ncbi:MAG: DUF4349 domain-containing protein [Flavobacteriaceae bacterium]|nr:DUF4349 domain-containing protein [Flavobacteriaceae bacterium]